MSRVGGGSLGLYAALQDEWKEPLSSGVAPLFDRHQDLVVPASQTCRQRANDGGQKPDR
jgi:hypothetical protein